MCNECNSKKPRQSETKLVRIDLFRFIKDNLDYLQAINLFNLRSFETHHKDLAICK